MADLYLPLVGSTPAAARPVAVFPRALVNEPLLLLADEPTGNLDTARKVQVFKDFAALAAGGITVLMVTHDTHAAEFATSCYRIDGGRLEKIK